MHQQAATTLSNSSNNVTNIGAQGCQDFKRGLKIGNSKLIPTLSLCSIWDLNKKVGLHYETQQILLLECHGSWI